jgi:metallo-beta-lactamase family protein
VETTDWLAELDTSRLKGILLVHGEKKAQAALKNRLEEKGYPNVQIVRYGHTYDLD